MKFTTTQLVTLAVFGALWGLVEMSLGAALHALKVPLSGLLLAAVGVVIALAGRAFVPQRGSTLFIGVIAAVIKLFSIGSVIAGPLVGILAEALLAEIVLSLWGAPRRSAFLAAGSLAVLWTLVQPFFTGLLLFGRSFIVIWLDVIDEGVRLFGLNPNLPWLVLALLALLRIGVGVVAGWLAWEVALALKHRLARQVAVV